MHTTGDEIIEKKWSLYFTCTTVLSPFILIRLIFVLFFIIWWYIFIKGTSVSKYFFYNINNYHLLISIIEKIRISDIMAYYDEEDP